MRNILSDFWNNVQHILFPDLENRTGKLSDDNKKLIAILEFIRIENYLPDYRFRFGRPPKNRMQVARSFIAKTVLKITHTDQLIKLLRVDHQLRVICGWQSSCDLPSESTFSRAFHEFADSCLPDKVHQALISEYYEGRVIGHLSKDSTPLKSKEKPLKKEGTYKERKNASIRRLYMEKKGELQSRRQKQLHQSLEEMIDDLPKHCDIGAKKSAQGYQMTWKGYKVHAAVDDNCTPIAVIMTSASLNDCEVAIPLAQKSNQVVTNFYDLMDAAYDLKEIQEHSISLGHIPIIDKHSRTKIQKIEKGNENKAQKTLNFCPAEKRRYRMRFSKERFNALFKEYYGGNSVQYKGYQKVFCHVMFGVLTLTTSIILNL